jgi:hypothetical protein
MSIEDTTMVWARLDVTGGELLLALAIADFSNKHGEGIWPSVKTLGQMSRQGERTVRRQLAKFREVKWLEVVTEGGLAGGRGKTTQYRINPDWIKGAELAGFPDSKESSYADENPAKVAAFQGKPCQPKQETLPNGAGNPATAMADNPSGSINDPKTRARELSPTGSRSAGEDPEALDENFARSHWWNLAREHALHSAGLFGISGPRPATLDEVPNDAPNYPRATLTKACEDARDWALGEHRRLFPLTNAQTSEIVQGVLTRVNAALKVLAPQAFEPRKPRLKVAC